MLAALCSNYYNACDIFGYHACSAELEDIVTLTSQGIYVCLLLVLVHHQGEAVSSNWLHDLFHVVLLHDRKYPLIIMTKLLKLAYLFFSMVIASLDCLHFVIINRLVMCVTLSIPMVHQVKEIRFTIDQIVPF